MNHLVPIIASVRLAALVTPAGDNAQRRFLDYGDVQYQLPNILA